MHFLKILNMYVALLSNIGALKTSGKLNRGCVQTLAPNKLEVESFYKYPMRYLKGKENPVVASEQLQR